MQLMKRLGLGIAVIFGLIIVALYGYARVQRNREARELAVLHDSLMVTSASFPSNGDLAVSCTCKGAERSPALRWEANLPATKSFVVLTTDYDAPAPALPLFNFTHWIVYNLPASVHSLPEGITQEQVRLLGGKIGKNSAGELRYTGACPPVGRHTYVFRVYALDNILSFSGMPDRNALLDAMRGHIIDYGELKGYF